MHSPLPEELLLRSMPLYDGPRLVMGMFDAEAYWRPSELAKLPSLRPVQEHAAADYMDELLFPLCGEDGLAVTRHPRNAAQAAYLHDAGFHFRSLTCNSDQPNGNEQRNKDVFQLVSEQCTELKWKRLMRELPLAAYAVIPSAEAFVQKYGLEGAIPDAEVVKQVNSKAYSLRLAQQLDLNPPGRIAEGADTVQQIGAELLNRHGKLILKDPYGVSGSGNLVVEASALLTRLTDYLRAQERAGKQVQLIVEPWLNKQADFSCQLYIASNGWTELLGVQRMVNRQLNYGGSYAADTHLVNRLAEAGYFEHMERLVAQMYIDGYYGPVCIDSMLLENGEVYPVVEINARHSMGMLNHCLDAHLERWGKRSFLTCLQLGLPEREQQSTMRPASMVEEDARTAGTADQDLSSSSTQFEQLLMQLDEIELLYTPERRTGVMPLSANTLFSPTVHNRSGRWYVSLVADNAAGSKALGNQLHQALLAFGYRIYS
ncbi:hypothetical protein [Paenibacillus popilliae]|uniref:ATP-grasp domain-containing protein n=1 Tax=Paenibacillus popilliae TaxID=78057 RepID=A0ABY3ARZ3_PAEPP|nr:hypothetical protein [Paenibacillus sp. SDF0028]TQR44766.1 hypothetical protein C7Y44_10520 [Paenibacillus sp. SDF0028]